MKYKITADQKRWHETVRNYGCVITQSHPVQIHHVKGASFKHNKTWIGQWFVLPLSWGLHDVHSNHPLNITHHKRAFEAEYGNQASLWLHMVSVIESQGKTVPPDEIKSVIGELA